MARDQSTRLQEQIEVLDGSRAGTARRQAAVRIEDLSALFQLQSKLQSVDVTSAPTAAQFNALRKDLVDISLRLNAVIQSLQARLL